MKEGFDGYLTKPISGDRLEEELIRMLPAKLIHKSEEDGEAVDESLTYTNDYKKRIPLLITAETVCDLPAKMLESLNIPVIAYNIITAEGSFKDSIEIDSRGLVTYLKNSDGNIHSEPPHVKDYEAFFAEQLLRANNVLHISLAKHVNKAYEIASEAARAFENVTVIDSGHLSSGMGLAVLAAHNLAGKGMPVDKVVEELQKEIHTIHTSFIVDDMDHLVRAGRVKEMVGRIASAFMVHPILVLKNSRMGVGRVYFGARENCWHSYIRSALNVKGEIDRSLLFVTYVGLTSGELDIIADEIKQVMEFDKIIFQKASPSISSNCGIGTFGLLFRTKQPK